MKKNLNFLLIAATMFSTLGFTSCDENSTLDIPGPEVEFTLNYMDIQHPMIQALRTLSEWKVVASDTIPGIDIERFLKSDSTNSKYADAVVAATVNNGKLTVSGGNFSFAGVDSVKIVYRLVGNTKLYDLVVGAPSTASSDVITFDDLKITKDQVLDMMTKDKVASLQVKLNSATPTNCFASGAAFTFHATSTLSVKVMAALSGGGLAL